MMLKQVVLAHFEPLATGLGSWRIPKCLGNGPFLDQKWVKNGSKTCFSKSDPRPFGMLKQVFLARFEPVLTEFSPFHDMYAPLCALRPYLRAVWWSRVEGCRLEDIYIYIYIYVCMYVCMYVYSLQVKFRSLPLNFNSLQVNIHSFLLNFTSLLLRFHSL